VYAAAVRLRVIVYNVKAFRLGLDRVTAVLRELGPDLLLLQESGARRSLRALGSALEMQVAADPLSPLRRRVKNAVLARPPWRIISHRLHRLEGSERFYPRGALVAQAGRAGRRVWAVSAHLGLVPVERGRHARDLTSLLEELPGPIVLGMDLNETPERPSATWLARRYVDAWDEAGTGDGPTFPSLDASARIDYLFVSQGVRVEGIHVAELAGAASDHLPIVADLSLEP
jgi:endonuclease/exonuclease/phosphatase family metal-dependent hydrolase